MFGRKEKKTEGKRIGKIISTGYPSCCGGVVARVTSRTDPKELDRHIKFIDGRDNSCVFSFVTTAVGVEKDMINKLIKNKYDIVGETEAGEISFVKSRWTTSSECGKVLGGR